jgi:outer membrane protein
LFLIACFTMQAAPAADLLAVYQRALQNDPQLREAEANRLAALEAKPQAVAALLPQVSGSAQVSKERDVGPDNTVESVSLGPGTPPVIETFPFHGTTTTTTHVYRVDLKQNMFAGRIGWP